MRRWEIRFTVPSAPVETIEAAALRFDEHWATLFNESASTIWAAPVATVLSITAGPELPSAAADAKGV